MWPGCVLPKHQDLVESDEASIARMKPEERRGFLLSLGLMTSESPTVEETLKTLRGAALDEHLSVGVRTRDMNEVGSAQEKS